MASNLDEVMEKIQVRTDLERWSFRAEKAVQGTKTMVATVWPTLNLSFAHGREWQCHCRLCIGSPCLSCYPLIKDPKLHHLLSSLLGFWLCGSACWYSMPEYTVSMLFLWFPRRGLIGMRSSSSEFTPPPCKVSSRLLIFLFCFALRDALLPPLPPSISMMPQDCIQLHIGCAAIDMSGPDDGVWWFHQVP